MKLVTLSTRSLNNEDMFAVCTTTLEICKPHVSTFSPLTQEAIKRLTGTTTELGIQLNCDRANALTKVVNTENNNSDKVWKQIKKQLKLHVDNPVNTEKAQAAKELITLFKPYWTSEDLAQKTQVDTFGELFTKYTDEWKPKAALAGIDELMTYFIDSIKRMGAAWTERNDIEGDMKSTKSASAWRIETVSHYNTLMTLLSHESELVPNEKINAMMADLNALRSKYATLLATRKIIAEKKKKEEEAKKAGLK